MEQADRQRLVGAWEPYKAGNALSELPAAPIGRQNDRERDQE